MTAGEQEEETEPEDQEDLTEDEEKIWEEETGETYGNNGTGGNTGKNQNQTCPAAVPPVRDRAPLREAAIRTTQSFLKSRK